MQLTSDFYLRLRMHGPLPPFPYIPSWCVQGYLYDSHCTEAAERSPMDAGDDST